ncbi:MAG: endonuclease VII domain-containing protein [Planctomycetota bacterium]|nr:endonuclease VII domain-containing protein [Planctomycetota bacterium]MDI6787697.1 endonuclease VII domain-containing protein [Planctomycetota bacterium]
MVKFTRSRKIPNINVGDYVVATRNINSIQKRSVGLVKKVSGEVVTVFFIGVSMTVQTNIANVKYLDITKTGKPNPKKICNICHLLKDDIKEFDINQTDAKGRKTTRPSCQVCRVAIDGKRITPDDEKKLDAKTPKGIFTCPICKKTSIAGVTANLVKDHDHITGKGRTWICDSCNTGLGRFKDDIKLLQEAIDYLEKYS